MIIPLHVLHVVYIPNIVIFHSTAQALPNTATKLFSFAHTQQGSMFTYTHNIWTTTKLIKNRILIYHAGRRRDDSEQDSSSSCNTNPCATCGQQS